MREKIIYSLGILAAVLLVRNLFLIFMRLPDDAAQGMIYRILYFHVPAAWTAYLGYFAALVCSVLFLAGNNYRYDSLALSMTEVSLAFATVNIVTGMIWARIIWGIWWTWDYRLTSALICCLLYAGYLVLRRAIEEPAHRAKVAAVFSIFAFADVPIVWFSIKWWRNQHPGPVFWGGGYIDPDMRSAEMWNWLALLLVSTVLVLIRDGQERTQREMDSVRRFAHAM